MDEAMLSVRLKHGIHTIFLFIDSLAPFEDVTTTLLQVLRERYPDGLTQSVSPLKTTRVPIFDDDAEVVYATLVNSHDPSQGWKRLKILRGDTPAMKGIQNGTILAFTFTNVDADDSEPVEFAVDWPRLDDEYEEEEEDGAS